MEKRRLGNDGPELSVVGLGCNNFGMRLGQDESAAVLDAVLEAGITHLDTAEMYGEGRAPRSSSVPPSEPGGTTW